MPINKTCAQCSKEFYVPIRRDKTAKYCSVPCRATAFTGMKRPESFARKISEVWTQRYKNGYVSPLKGRKLPRETIRKIRASKIGAKNPMWKGDDVGYAALHDWCKVRIPMKECARCVSTKHLDMANKSGLYKREVDDWEVLCRRCHMLTDGRLKEFLKNRKPFKNARKSSL